MDIIRDYVVGLTIEDEQILRKLTGISEYDTEGETINKLVKGLLDEHDKLRNGRTSRAGRQSDVVSQGRIGGDVSRVSG